MYIVINRKDGVVIMGGVAAQNVDMSTFPATVTAEQVHWWDSTNRGALLTLDPVTKEYAQTPITDFTPYAGVIAAYKAALIAPPPVLSEAEIQAEIIKSFEFAVQAYLDTTAQSWQYESINTAVTYVASTNATFKAEATVLIAWRDQVWGACYTAMAAIKAGTQAMPATAAAFVATLPAAPTRPVV